MKNKWKLIAWIFIILFVLSVLLISWAWNAGTDAIEKENTCSYNVCDGYDAFFYDDYEEVCYCYLDNEIVYQEYLK